MDVVLPPEAEAELHAMAPGERVAMLNALEKLRALGLMLGAPHSSQVKGTTLCERRPWAGRSSWRGLYQRIETEFVIGAIGTEAKHDRLAFQRSVTAAERRLTRYRAERES